VTPAGRLTLGAVTALGCVAGGGSGACAPDG